LETGSGFQKVRMKEDGTVRALVACIGHTPWGVFRSHSRGKRFMTKHCFHRFAISLREVR
jgi:hypothetical protein